MYVQPFPDLKTGHLTEYPNHLLSIGVNFSFSLFIISLIKEKLPNLNFIQSFFLEVTPSLLVR